MKLAQALNEKNRIVKKISGLQDKVRLYNSFIKGNNAAYDTAKLLDEMEQTIAELSKLKAKIHRANIPVQTQIFRLSELKSYAKFLKGLEVKEGKVLDERWNAEVVEWESQVSVKERDALLEKVENEITLLQNQLDIYNFETEIE